MGVRDNDASSVNNGSGQTQQKASPQPAAQERRSLRAGLSQYRALSRSQMGDVLEAFTKAANALYENNADGAPRIIAMDGAQYDMHYSMALVANALKIGGKDIVAVFATILTGSNSSPLPVTQTIQGQQIDVVLTTDDAWDNDSWAKVEMAVSRHFHENVVILNAGSMDIPDGLDMTDESLVRAIVWNAQEANMTAFETMAPEEFDHWNVAEAIDVKKTRVVAQVQYNGADATSITGQPIRNDIQMKVSTVDRNQSQQYGFQHQSSKSLLEVNSFVDLVYAPSTQPPVYGQPAPTQIFIPRLVITRILSAAAEPYTPELALLGLGTATTLTQNYAWAGQFRNYAHEQVHNIGLVGYRMPNPAEPGKGLGPIDTSSNSFSENDFYELIHTTCHPVPVVSLDCERVGPESWLMSAFAEAANGNTNSQQWLIEAADRLTNGFFSRHYQGGPIAHNEHNILYSGSYVDEQGVKRDRREIDSLAVLHYTGKNGLDTSNLFETTFNDINRPDVIRLDFREHIVKDLAANVTIRGKIDRVTLDTAFLDALVKAIADAGLLVEQEGVAQLYGSNNQVGNNYLHKHMANISGNMLYQGGPAVQYTSHRPMNRWQR